MAFTLTDKQIEATDKVLRSPAMHKCLFGGSRSGKTFLLVRTLIARALKAPGSRHAMFRFRFNAIKNSIVLDTFPKVMRLAFPGLQYSLNKTDWFVTLPNGSEIWFGGLDDKERTEKILGMEFATLYFNEASQIPYRAIQTAMTRLAQLVQQSVDKANDLTELAMRVYYDLNPPKKSHWSYQLFRKKIDPIDRKPLVNPDDYVSFQMNPHDNAANLASTYIATLEAMSAADRKRFLLGEYADDDPNALFNDVTIEKHRVIDQSAIPQLTRIVVGIDPSGADDESDTADAIGIVAGGLGTDGRAYLLRDSTVTAGPAVWGKVATDLYDYLAADIVVGETNYGGAMVNFVVQTARPRTPFKCVTATRGKHVRAEPFSALYEQGKIRHAGFYPELEEEVCAFSTSGYLGTSSPNRADAWFWVLTELFPGLIAPRKSTVRYAAAPRPRDIGAGY